MFINIFNFFIKCYTGDYCREYFCYNFVEAGSKIFIIVLAVAVCLFLLFFLIYKTRQSKRSL